jgi:hypothetical protein
VFCLSLPRPSPPRPSAGGPFYFHKALYKGPSHFALRTSHFADHRELFLYFTFTGLFIFHLHWLFYISPSLAFLYFTFPGLNIHPAAWFIFHLPRPSQTAGSRIYISPSPAFSYGREPNLYFTFPGLHRRPGAKFIFHLPRPPCTWQAGSREPGIRSPSSVSLLVLARQAQVVQVVGPSGSVAGMRVSTPTLTAFSYFSEFFSYFS